MTWEVPVEISSRSLFLVYVDKVTREKQRQGVAREVTTVTCQVPYKSRAALMSEVPRISVTDEVLFPESHAL